MLFRSIDSNIDLKALIKVIIHAGHSRVPVYDETVDHIIGILYVKDLIKLLLEKPKKFNIKKLLHEPFFVPETMPLDDLLLEFKMKKLHLAIVVDEYGGVGGIVTLEDILEEIVGDINDEFDAEELPELEKISPNTWEFDPRMLIADFNEELGLNIPSEDFDTIGGFVFDLFGRIPEKDEITKYETLVRMIGKNKEIIPPLEFLSISKRTKLYSHITLEVINQACNTFKNRKESFSVNLSIDDIKDAHTVQEIIKTLIKTNTASKIIFEILESEGIENYEDVTNFITQIKALGARIAIDDFGTGYSNFEHILKLNVDYIKIDGSLIKGMKENNKHKIIVETIIDFAKKVGSKTIAEFVYDQEILDITKQIGIDFAQGFYVGKPFEIVV